MGLLISQIGFVFYFLKIYYHLKLNYIGRNKLFSLSVFLKDIFLLNNLFFSHKGELSRFILFN
jgi:hypothetical protein